MRLYTSLALVALLSNGVFAVCNCPESAAQQVRCSGPDDFECVCNNSYSFVLEQCFASSDCTPSERNGATAAFARGCQQQSSSVPSTSTQRITPRTTSSSSSEASTSSSNTAASTTSTDISTTSLPPLLSATSSIASSTPSSVPRPMSTMTKAKIIVGSVAAGVCLVVLIIAITACICLNRRYKKQDMLKKEMGDREAQHFIAEGFRNRAPSLSSQGVQRGYSLQRPLSYTMAEYMSRPSTAPPPEHDSLLDEMNASSDQGAQAGQHQQYRSVSMPQTLAQPPVERSRSMSPSMVPPHARNYDFVPAPLFSRPNTQETTTTTNDNTDVPFQVSRKPLRSISGASIYSNNDSRGSGVSSITPSDSISRHGTIQNASNTTMHRISDPEERNQANDNFSPTSDYDSWDTPLSPELDRLGSTRRHKQESGFYQPL